MKLVGVDSRVTRINPRTICIQIAVTCNVTDTDGQDASPTAKQDAAAARVYTAHATINVVEGKRSEIKTR